MPSLSLTPIEKNVTDELDGNNISQVLTAGRRKTTSAYNIVVKYVSLKGSLARSW